MELEALGAVEIVGADTPQAILIRVTNPAGLAASQSGVAAGLAATLLPQVIQGQIFSKIKSGFFEALKESTPPIDPGYFEVEVVPDPGKGVSIGSDLGLGVVLGIVVTTFTGIVLKFWR